MMNGAGTVLWVIAMIYNKACYTLVDLNAFKNYFSWIMYYFYISNLIWLTIQTKEVFLKKNF